MTLLRPGIFVEMLKRQNDGCNHPRSNRAMMDAEFDFFIPSLEIIGSRVASEERTLKNSLDFLFYPLPLLLPDHLHRIFDSSKRRQK